MWRVGELGHRFPANSTHLNRRFHAFSDACRARRRPTPPVSLISTNINETPVALRYVGNTRWKECSLAGFGWSCRSWWPERCEPINSAVLCARKFSSVWRFVASSSNLERTTCIQASHRLINCLISLIVSLWTSLEESVKSY